MLDIEKGIEESTLKEFLSIWLGFSENRKEQTFDIIEHFFGFIPPRITEYTIEDTVYLPQFIDEEIKEILDKNYVHLFQDSNDGYANCIVFLFVVRELFYTPRKMTIKKVFPEINFFKLNVLKTFYEIAFITINIAENQKAVYDERIRVEENKINVDELILRLGL